MHPIKLRHHPANSGQSVPHPGIRIFSGLDGWDQLQGTA